MSDDRSQSAGRKDDYFQQYWQDLTVVSSGEEVVLHQPEQQEPSTTKKKSRGNRHLQKFRAKLRKRGLNTEEINNIIESRQIQVNPDLPVGDTVELPNQVRVNGLLLRTSFFIDQH